MKDVGYGEWQTVNSRKTPCYGCSERVGGCHSTCEKYKEFQALRKAESETLKKEYSATQQFGKRKRARRKKPCMRRE